MCWAHPWQPGRPRCRSDLSRQWAEWRRPCTRTSPRRSPWCRWSLPTPGREGECGPCSWRQRAPAAGRAGWKWGPRRPACATWSSARRRRGRARGRSGTARCPTEGTVCRTRAPPNHPTWPSSGWIAAGASVDGGMSDRRRDADDAATTPTTPALHLQRKIPTCVNRLSVSAANNHYLRPLLAGYSFHRRFTCEQDNANSYGQIFGKFGKYADYEVEKGWFNLGRLGLGVNISVSAPAACRQQYCDDVCLPISRFRAANQTVKIPWNGRLSIKSCTFCEFVQFLLLDVHFDNMFGISETISNYYLFKLCYKRYKRLFGWQRGRQTKLRLKRK